MKIIKRKTEKTAEPIVIGNNDKDTYLPYCQASFNSNGNITLRNYDRANKDKDEIIILSNSETKAVFELFSQMSRKNKNYTLPF